MTSEPKYTFASNNCWKMKKKRLCFFCFLLISFHQSFNVAVCICSLKQNHYSSKMSYTRYAWLWNMDYCCCKLPEREISNNNKEPEHEKVAICNRSSMDLRICFFVWVLTLCASVFREFTWLSTSRCLFFRVDPTSLTETNNNTTAKSVTLAKYWCHSLSTEINNQIPFSHHLSYERLMDHHRRQGYCAFDDARGKGEESIRFEGPWSIILSCR
jgi:hypothetical protein